MSDRRRIGVSACLTGAEVRFDGGHKHDDFVASLGAVADLITVCPEVEIGLGTPRESLRLIHRRGEPVKLVAPRSGSDHSDAMRSYAAAKAAVIASWDLDGFIVKKDSPSCGMERVRVYGDKGVPTRDGRGRFTEALMAANPLLPVEEEGRLRDAALRENFLARMRNYHALRRLFAGPWSLGDLVAFHSTVKLELLAHSPLACRDLGRLVAKGRQLPRAELASRYLRGVMDAMAVVPSQGRHINVLQHIAGYFRRAVPSDERQEIVELIADYHDEREPRTTPLALLRHHARRQGAAYLTKQTYLKRVES